MSSEESMLLTIKSDSVPCHSLEVSVTDSVEDVKTKISNKTQFSRNNLTIIFAGKVLENDQWLKDLKIGNHSVLHVIGEEPSVVAPSIDNEGSTATEAAPRPVASQFSYYVYCKACDSLQPGKLRVRCKVCQETGLIIERDPDSWDDVLAPDKIHGKCTVCQTTQPAQFYFKCGSHDSRDSSVPLKHAKSNRKAIECVTCTLVSPLILVYPCQDRHVMCVECFTSYGNTCLDSRQFTQDPTIGYSLPCPVGCENSLIEETHHFCLLGREQYERYKDFAAEECLLQSGGVMCPQPGCGEGMILDVHTTNIQCANCRHEFCRCCRLASHVGDCLQTSSQQVHTELWEVDADRATRSRWETQSLDTIQKITKPCPQCTTRTEKSGGCMHMFCTRCKLEWCWVCEKEWNRQCQGDHWFG